MIDPFSDPTVNRLAILVKDHCYGYKDFAHIITRAAIVLQPDMYNL